MNKKWLKIALGMLCVILIYFTLFHKSTDPDDYCAKIDKITNVFIKDMHKNYGLIYRGQGGSCMDNIKRISVLFKKPEKSDIPESRVLLVNCVEEFLRRVNADEDVRPFLVQYPFTNENVHISIGFQKPQNASEHETIVHVFNVEDRVVYSVYEKIPPPANYRHKPKLKEPYEEALRIVKESGRLDVDMSDERAAS